jgi:hypothetical protein
MKGNVSEGNLHLSKKLFSHFVFSSDKLLSRFDCGKQFFKTPPATKNNYRKKILLNDY